MILLSLALLAAPAMAPEPQRVRARAVRVAHVVRPRPLLVTCYTRNCRVDPNSKYRVADTDNRIDFKTRVVERGAFQNCGVTGMPVCPSKGMPIITSEGQ